MYVCLCFFSGVTIELVGQDPNTGLIEPPDVSEPENGNDPILCLCLSAGVTLVRNVAVNLATVTGGTAQGRVSLLIGC